MDKIIRIFLIFIFATTITINVSGCRWVCTNNDYDLDDYNQQDG